MDAASRLSWIARSFSARLLLVVAVFVSVPIILYQYLNNEHDRRQEMLLSLVREHGLAIGRALEPALARADEAPYYQLGRELSPYASDYLTLKLLYKPTAPEAGGGFFYVASAPAVSSSDVAAERALLASSGVLDRLGLSCDGNLPLALRVDMPDSPSEMITAVTPVHTERGCWALVLSSRLGPRGIEGLGEPFWTSGAVRFSAVIYVLSLLIIVGLVLSMARNLRGFAALARQIREERRTSVKFAGNTTVPELEQVANDLDNMVQTLASAAAVIRSNAEDVLHAFKNQIGVLRQWLEPIERRIDPTDTRAMQAAAGVHVALDRLMELIQAARQLDRNTADMLDPPRDPVDVTGICCAVVDRFHDVAREHGCRIESQIEERLAAEGRAGAVESIVENLIDNALGFSPEGGTVRVLASHDRGSGRLVISVEDDGPGVSEDRIAHIFDRYYSYRPSEATDELHFGLGLWLVRQNARAMGGDARAENRSDGGLRVRVEIPHARRAVSTPLAISSPASPATVPRLAPGD